MLASAIDGLSQSGKLPNAIGTVAGDDTVIVVADTAAGGAGLAKKILGLANSKSGGK
jgi:transcriptional regulator of arginine metabolism